MITTFDKFIVSVIGAIIFALNNFFGVDFTLPEGTFESIVSIVTAAAVWLVPNKEIQ